MRRVIRRPSDREMEARWRDFDYDMISWNLYKVLGEKMEEPEYSRLTRLAWNELPREVREKIKDWVKAKRLKEAAQR